MKESAASSATATMAGEYTAFATLSNFGKKKAISRVPDKQQMQAWLPSQPAPGAVQITKFWRQMMEEATVTRKLPPEQRGRTDS